MHPIESQTFWGEYQKHSLDITVAYPDGSASKDGCKAGFAVYFPELDTQPDLGGIASRIPGDQTIARAEAFGVLAALLLAKSENPLDIHCDRESLVNCINRFKTRKPFSHELRYIKDSSLVLRILDEINQRKGATNIIHVKAHKRDKVPTKTHFNPPPLSKDEEHQEYNKKADFLAKGSLHRDHTNIPEETKYLPSVTVLMTKRHKTTGPQYIYENNPSKLYQNRYIETCQNYHFKGKWHLYLFDQSIWQAPTLSVLHDKKGMSLKKFLVQILGRTLPTFHRLNKVRAGLYPDRTCCICKTGLPKTIKHLFYICPTFKQQREDLLEDCLEICTAAGIKCNNPEVRSFLEEILLNHETDNDKFRSAGQISILLATWFKGKKVNETTALKAAKKLHLTLVSNHMALSLPRNKIATPPL